jgi:hypothetical protein
MIYDATGASRHRQGEIKQRETERERERKKRGYMQWSCTSIWKAASRVYLMPSMVQEEI